jgi:glycosyltransferase involved in cell wall biosynthesis
VIEAMSRACPILGSTTGGIPELIEPQFIFSTRDSKQIAKLIKATSKEQLEQQARFNFEASKDYIKATLDQRRQEFYAEFKKEMNL